MRSVQFGLYSIHVFFCLSSFFFFYRSFPWQALTIYRIAGNGEGIFIFLPPPANTHSFSSSRFQPLLHFFLLDLFLVIRLMALVLLRHLHFICIFIDAVKLELLTLTFQSNIVNIWAHTKLSQNERLHQLRFTPLGTTVYLEPPFIFSPFAKIYKKWRMCHFFTRD